MATYTSIHSGTAIDAAITKIQNLDIDVELAPYATQDYVENYIAEGDYATNTDITNKLTTGDYVNSTQVNNAIISKGYATTTYVDGLVNEINTDIDGLVLNTVTQSYSTTNASYPLLFSATSGISATTNRGDVKTILNNAIYANPSTGAIYATKAYGAVYNDYAEYRQTNDSIEPGRCVVELGDGSLGLSYKRLEAAPEIISDTFGFAIGETSICRTPIAVAGRVLAYPYEPIEEYKVGDPVCSGPMGTISKMTREEVCMYPDRMIGTVSEIPTYETWGQDNIKVNGRIWIRIR